MSFSAIYNTNIKCRVCNAASEYLSEDIRSCYSKTGTTTWWVGLYRPWTILLFPVCQKLAENDAEVEIIGLSLLGEIRVVPRLTENYRPCKMEMVVPAGAPETGAGLKQYEPSQSFRLWLLPWLTSHCVYISTRKWRTMPRSRNEETGRSALYRNDGCLGCRRYFNEGNRKDTRLSVICWFNARAIWGVCNYAEQASSGDKQQCPQAPGSARQQTEEGYQPR